MKPWRTQPEPSRTGQWSALYGRNTLAPFTTAWHDALLRSAFLDVPFGRSVVIGLRLNA